MTSEWQEVPFHRLLTLERRKAEIDPAATYKLVTLPLHGQGARLRKEVLGSELGSAKYRVRAGDLMVSKIDARKGSNSLLPIELDGAVVTGDFLSYSVDHRLADPAFLDLVVRTPWFEELCDTVSSGTTNRVRLDPKRFLNLSLRLPPLDEQRRIVDLVEALDDAVESALAAKLARLEVRDALADASFQSLSAAGSFITLSQALGDRGFVQTGPFGSQLHSHDYVDHGIPVVMPANIRDRRVDTDGIARIREEDAKRLGKHLLQPGDIVWSRRGDVTRFARITAADEQMICGTGCLLIRPTSPDTTSWLSVWLSSKSMKALIEDRAVGATMLNLNTSILSNLPVAAPSDDSEFIATAMEVIGFSDLAAGDHLFDLRELRSEILSSLLSGAHLIPESYDELISA